MRPFNLFHISFHCAGINLLFRRRECQSAVVDRHSPGASFQTCALNNAVFRLLGYFDFKESITSPQLPLKLYL